MRLYVAGPWKCREQVKEAAAKFEAAGHTITEKWWEHPDVECGLEGVVGEAAKELGLQADKDWKGVAVADRLIFLNLKYSEGKCVELGIALAEGIPILAVGIPRMNAFHYLPEVVWVESVEEAIEQLRCG